MFGATDNGSPVLHSLLHLDDSDLADLLQVIRVRELNVLERRGVMVLRPLLGVVESRHELTLLDDDFEPALAQLASAAVSGQLPAGPELRQRQPITLRGQPGVEVTAPLSVRWASHCMQPRLPAPTTHAVARRSYAMRLGLRLQGELGVGYHFM